MSIPPISSNESNKLPTPFSLRLTFDERAALEKAAGNKPLGAYIRGKLLEEHERPRRRRRRSRRPIKDEKALSALLGELGASRLASNLNQLAKAANSGSLPVTPETEKTLQEACTAVLQMRSLLMRALGYFEQ